MQKKRITYITNNRKKIINYCYNHDKTITKAQIMILLNCSGDLAYEVSKSMINCGLLKKIGKCKFEIIDQKRYS